MMGQAVTVRARNGDPFAVAALASSDGFRARAADLADRLRRPEDQVTAEATACLSEMAATHRRLALMAWLGLGRWLTRGYRFEVDDAHLRRLRDLDRSHALVWLPSHRSYLDTWVLPVALRQHGISPIYGLGGDNLNFFPFGTLARRAGLIFIRRSTTDDPIYRLALRAYLAHLLHQRANLAWAIEGGRTRTGKLSPPRYGLLRYLSDAAREDSGDETLLVPVSISYDRLPEVAAMAAEARGAAKQAEGVGWLLRFVRAQGDQLGRAHLDVGEPMSLRDHLLELEREDDGDGESHAVERIALEVCHGINRATAITPPALVTLVMLGTERALTLDEVGARLRPLLDYVERRGYPVVDGAALRTRQRVRAALGELVDAEVATRYDGGTATVWSVGPDAHLIAAFYRNTGIHFLVNRAIAELVAHRTIAEEPDDLAGAAWQEALRLREMLKFDFFFSRKRVFEQEFYAELALVDPEWEAHLRRPEHEYVARWHARGWLEQAQPLLAHLILRPFLEAYLVVAERLAAHDPAWAVDRQAFLEECLGVARQWNMQGRIANAESVSLELFKTALRLAEHRDLIDAQDADLAQRRRAFADELRGTVARVAAIADLGRSRA